MGVKVADSEAFTCCFVHGAQEIFHLTDIRVERAAASRIPDEGFAIASSTGPSTR
jgi:hypothetical protein